MLPEPGAIRRLAGRSMRQVKDKATLPSIKSRQAWSAKLRLERRRLCSIGNRWGVLFERASQSTRLSRRPRLDRQRRVAAPFGPRAVVDGGIGAAEDGEGKRDDAGGDAGPARGDHGLGRV